MIALTRCRSLKISRSMAKRKTATVETQKRKAKSVASADKVLALEREEQILRMRIGGARYQQIADRLGIAPSTVGRALQRGMARWQAQADDLVSEHIGLQLERLDRLLLSVWSDAVKGKLGAIDRVLKIEERRAKLLGLDGAADLNIEHSEAVNVTFKVEYGDPDNPSNPPSAKPPLLPVPDKKQPGKKKSR